MSGYEANARKNPGHPPRPMTKGRLRAAIGQSSLGIGTMTFDAEPTGAARAAHAFFHGNGSATGRQPGDPGTLDGLLPPGGALAGRVFSRLLGDKHDDPPLAPGTRVGAWRIGGLLGCGGCAVVYLTDRADGHFDQQVAIKVVRPRRELIAQFRRERQILASLRHPAIARLIDGGEIEGGQLWLAMEPVFGERIDDYVRSRKLSLDERLALFAGVCEAVAYAHRRQLVHRDIKPANVLVDEMGKPRLLDFGIAAADDELDGCDRGMTPSYASPEQRSGEAVTFASDIYQLGVMLRALIAPNGIRCPTLPLPRRKIVRRIEAIVAKSTAVAPGERYRRVVLLWNDVVAVRERRATSVAQSLSQRFAQFLQHQITRIRASARERHVSHVTPALARLGQNNNCPRLSA